MKTVYILKGLPASGKSTWAKKMVDQHPGSYKRINRDDLRAMLDNSYHSKGNERFALKVRDWLILQALKEGKHVILDDTNLNPQHEVRIRELVDYYRKETGQEVAVQVQFFDISLEEAIKRDLKRPVSVGERVIREIYNKYLAPAPAKVQAEQDKNLPKAILCDLDGTLAHIDHRNPFDASRCEEDALNEPIAGIVRSYAALGYHIILLSGRSAQYRTQTESWLYLHQIPFTELLMRQEKDQRKDSLIKREIYEASIKGRYFVEFVLDDRNQVVDMWRKELGLPCLQVNYGDF
jgi:predicted kinase